MLKYLLISATVVLLVVTYSLAQDASVGTQTAKGSIRFLLGGRLSHQIPQDVPGATDLLLQTAHPTRRPANGYVRMYVMADGLWIMEANGTRKQYTPESTVTPAMTTTPAGMGDREETPCTPCP